MTATDTPRILVNGAPGHAVEVADRGFALGDGLFETIAIRAGQPRYWPDHRDRLLDGCRRLGIPEPDPDILADELERARGDIAHGSARITVSRGPGPRGYAAPAQPVPTRVVACDPPAAVAGPSPRAFRLRWCATRLALQPALAGLKHLNRLEQVLARAEWRDPAIHEGIMRATDGRVVECVAANLFLIRDDRVITPALDECGVAGVMRRQVLRAAAALGVDHEIRRVEAEELALAEAVFVTNALWGPVPVDHIDGVDYSPEHTVLQRIRQRLERADG